MRNNGGINTLFHRYSMEYIYSMFSAYFIPTE
jgi:hypothetical protein